MQNFQHADPTLINALNQKDTAAVLSVVRAFHLGHSHVPHPPLWDVHDLEKGRGAQLVHALQTAVDVNYISGMILLLEPRRVRRVLQTRAAQNDHSEGVNHLKFIAAVFEDNTNGIAQVWRNFVLGENRTFARSSTELIDFFKTYATASETYRVEQERQRLEQVVGVCSKISQIKKI